MRDLLQRALQRWAYRTPRTRALTRFCGKTLPYLLYGGMALLVARRRARISGADALRPLMAGALAKLAALPLHRLVRSPRPFVARGLAPLLDVEPDNGFPSDHALQIGALLVAAATVQPAATPAYALGGASTLLARLGAGVHHTRDMVGGIALIVVADAVTRRIPLPAATRVPLSELLPRLRGSRR
jgi:membrane-associated phospholipid phosphatase